MMSVQKRLEDHRRRPDKEWTRQLEDKSGYKCEMKSYKSG